MTLLYLRGERPALLLTADATDPSATSNAVSAFRLLAETALARDLEGPLRHLRRSSPPLEVMFGKIVPYIIVGYVQMGVILIAGHYLFHVPMMGNLGLLLLVSLPFIAVNLGVGLTFSTLARNQLQAVHMAFFFFLPSILLSSFMFPFRGMPPWAQHVGGMLPLTHYLRIVRGIILKGNSLAQILLNLWPIGVFIVVALSIGLTRYRRTLD